MSLHSLHRSEGRFLCSIFRSIFICLHFLTLLHFCHILPSFAFFTIVLHRILFFLTVTPIGMKATRSHCSREREEHTPGFLPCSRELVKGALSTKQRATNIVTGCLSHTQAPALPALCLAAMCCVDAWWHSDQAQMVAVIPFFCFFPPESNNWPLVILNSKLKNFEGDAPRTYEILFCWETIRPQMVKSTLRYWREETCKGL